ncbi:MAG: hypothetical protein QOE96_1290, partial [Blastocatellia bacterium]|nr:hypothetical protein [Blastocatellia bacterium]
MVKRFLVIVSVAFVAAGFAFAQNTNSGTTSTRT